MPVLKARLLDGPSEMGVYSSGHLIFVCRNPITAAMLVEHAEIALEEPWRLTFNYPRLEGKLPVPERRRWASTVGQVWRGRLRPERLLDVLGWEAFVLDIVARKPGQLLPSVMPFTALRRTADLLLCSSFFPGDDIELPTLQLLTLLSKGEYREQYEEARQIPPEAYTLPGWDDHGCEGLVGGEEADAGAIATRHHPPLSAL